MKTSAALVAVVVGFAALGIPVLGIGSSQALAQMAPYDLMPPYRIDMLVRSAGLLPVAPPTRIGSTYVVRAVHRSGMPMRVVVDGHDGIILAVHPIAALHPREAIAPPDDADADPVDEALGYRAYARAPRPGAAIPNVPRYYGSEAAVGSIAPANRMATAPARTPMPRARPSSAPPAEVAAAKLAPEQSSVDPPAAPAVTNEVPAPPADHAFPPVQPLE